MKRRVDTFVLLALLAVFALFVHAHTKLGAAKAKPVSIAPRPAPSATLDRPTTKFDLLFNAREFALP